MATSSARATILQSIRQALIQSVPLPFPQSEGAADLYQPSSEALELVFAAAFAKLQGKFVFCANEQELHQQLQQLITANGWTKVFCKEDQWSTAFSSTADLESCDAAITGCEYLVARTGSIVLSAAQQSGRTVSVYAPIHVCIAYTPQLVYEVKEALQLLKDKYGDELPSLISFASGPSRTADIEKTLVTGVHGPKEVYLFLIDQPIQ